MFVFKGTLTKYSSPALRQYKSRNCYTYIYVTRTFLLIQKKEEKLNEKKKIYKC